MAVISDLLTCWREGSWVTRAALTVAAGAAVVHVASLAGFGWQDVGAVGIVLHLGVMILLFGVIVGRVRDLLARRWRGGARRSTPWKLVLLSVALACYALVWFAGVFAAYGEGGHEMRDGREVWVGRGGTVMQELTRSDVRWLDARMLSVFSAVWLAFALPLAIIAFRRSVRITHPETVAPTV